jgi:hypothetical protein
MKRVVPLLVMLVALAGCVTLPEQGPVNSGPTEAGRPQPGTFDYNPEGPRPGDPPETIVAGFIDSLRETPLTFSVARSFLTDAGSKKWVPSRRTIVYDDGSLQATIVGDQARVSLGESVQLDSRGSWLGDPTAGKGVAFNLHLVREQGEWRIADPPDALVVSRTHFDTRFVRYDLHFFDPSAKILVPEPVYLPAGVQTPSLLVSGLLAGPDPALQSVERTFFPAGTRLELSVPVEGGVADVPLSGEILDTDSGQRDLAMAQLAWTLRQVPGIERIRVTVDGTPLDRTTGASARSVLGWSSYDPSVPSANTDLYGLNGGDVVSESDGDVAVATTAYRGTSLRSLGVSLDGGRDARFTAVTGDGGRALSSVVAASTDTTRKPRRVYSGTDLLGPAYDVFGHLWLLDRTGSGARLVVDGQRPQNAPGITGADVTAFELSRDGTRLAAVVDGQVELARISRSEDGRPTRILRARHVSLGDESGGKVVDVGWLAPDTLGVLVRLGSNISQVVRASVDGSFALDAEPSLEPLFERAESLVTWPGPDAAVYLQTRGGRLYVVSPTGHWAPAVIPEGIHALTFPG